MREETLLEKVAIAIMFTAFIVFWVWVPDFTLGEDDCAKQDPLAYVGTLCSESQAK